VQAAAQANLNQPRYRATRGPTGVECGRRAPADRAKTTAVGVEIVASTRSDRRGTGDGMHEQTCNLNWGPTRGRKVRQTKKISCRMTPSGSDEAIVSWDPIGQHNRLASQGPLDRIVAGCVGAKPLWLLPFGAKACRRRSPLLAAYKRGLTPRRSRSNSCLKPYWGKPAVRNFRGGGGNTGDPECVSQTLHGHWVSSFASRCAPPLHSTAKVLS